MAMYTFEKQLEEEVRAQSSIKSNGAAAESAVQKVKDDVQQVRFRYKYFISVLLKLYSIIRNLLPMVVKQPSPTTEKS